MRRFRFHLGTLVILILVLGIGFAALRESNETWDSGIFSTTLPLSTGKSGADHPTPVEELLTQVRGGTASSDELLGRY